MNKTDEILERLKNAQQQQIDNPDDFTDLIMGSLDSASSLQERVRRGSVILPIVRTVLSLAAMWIIGFFIYLQFDGSAPIEEKNYILSDVPQNGATLREVYKNRLCQECKKTISYTKIRSKLYENK